MKQSKKKVCNPVTVFLCLVGVVAYAQTQQKTFSESFEVTADAVLDIDTSHADIEFETWNKDKVVIDAAIMLEGASEEEANIYFKNGGFEIMGNSTRVTVSTNSPDLWSVRTVGDNDIFHIEIPEMPEFDSFDYDFDFFEMENMPPMPPVPSPNFDYEAYKEDGEKYLKEWQENFQKDFGEPYKERMKEWQERMEEKRKEMQIRREERNEKRQEAHNERLEKMAMARAERAQKRVEAIQKRRQNNQARLFRSDSIYFSRSHRDHKESRPNIFYFNSGGENRNYKVKKTIKIKMPKSTKIKMNVRHGEVKLAENTNNINATLSHASLFAATIDGDKTTVMASYSPVSVEKWNYGRLQADYSDRVDLKEVLNLRLNSTSSDVTIENLSKTAYIKNSFGPLLINTVSRDFETLDITLQNAELFCELPDTAYTIYIDGNESNFIGGPNELALRMADNRNKVHKVHNREKDSGKSIIINSNYSEVLFE